MDWDDLSVDDLRERMDRVWAMRCEVVEARKRYKDLDGVYQGELELLRTLMEDNGMHRFDTTECFGSTKETEYVTVPQTEEAKKAFFDWLNEQGVFYDYATVNYNSLQTLWRTEYEKGREVPGVSEPKVRKQLTLYRGKK